MQSATSLQKMFHFISENIDIGKWKPLQYCKVIILQIIKINGKKKKRKKIIKNPEDSETVKEVH